MATRNVGLGLTSPVADGGTAHKTDTATEYTSGKLHSFKSGGVEKGYIAHDGGVVAPTRDVGGAIYNVKAYGAAGDGVTEEAPAVTAALAAAEASGGGRVYFPPGSYLVNTKVFSAASNIVVDFGEAEILNTTLLATEVVFGEDSYAMFNFTGERVQVRGGHFVNCLSEGVRIYGEWVGGDTYTGAGFTSDHKVSGVEFVNCDGSSISIRFFRNATVENVVVRDKGAGAAAHVGEINFRYGTAVVVKGCKVIDNQNGGGVDGLYVDGLQISECYGDVTNPTVPQSCDAFYVQFCKNVTLTGSQGYCMTGGVAFKASVGCENVAATGNILKVDGAGSDPYASVLMQGVNGFKVSDNDLFSPTDIYNVRAEFHSIPLTNSRNGQIANNRCTGGGVHVALDTGATRGPVDVDNNRLQNGSIYMLQSFPSGSVSGNRLYTATDYTTTTQRAAIFVDRCYGVIVEKNMAINEDATNQAKVGVLANLPVFSTIRDNTVLYTSAVALSVGYELTGAPVITYWENNEAVLAGTKIKGVTTASQLKRVAANWGDAAATLTVGANEETNRWESPLTVDRAVTLSTTGAFNGARFRIVRTAAATGAFNLNVGTGPLKALAVGQWCDVAYNGSAWMLEAFGSL